MDLYKTILSEQEKKWILERRITRLSDNKEVQIYPMGAERFLFAVLKGTEPHRYAIQNDIEGKNILVIPGHGTSSFLFAQSGAKSVTTYDQDPITIAWMKAFKKYYYYREHDAEGTPQASIAELFSALICWYPPLVIVPGKRWIHTLYWALYPNSLRRIYVHYLVELVQRAIQAKSQDSFELNQNIQFHVGTLDTMTTTQKKQTFDSAFIPYLLGVNNGIEQEKDIVLFLQQLMKMMPHGRILVSPSRNTRDFHFIGKRYFVTTGYSCINDIPTLKEYLIEEDPQWFRHQGLVIFGLHQT